MLVHRFLEESARRDARCDRAHRSGAARLVRRARPARESLRESLPLAGVSRGDRVVIALENSIELVGAYLGAMKAGAVAVPLPAGPRSDRLAAAVADCSPAVCVIDPATAHEVDARRVAGRRRQRLRCGSRCRRGACRPYSRPARGPRHGRTRRRRIGCIDVDLAAIIYTSGSTGEPRGVMLTHRNIVANTRSIVSYLDLTARDRVMCVLPFYYVYGLSLLHTHLAVGGSVVIDNRFVVPERRPRGDAAASGDRLRRRALDVRAAAAPLRSRRDGAFRHSAT